MFQKNFKLYIQILDLDIVSLNPHKYIFTLCSFRLFRRLKLTEDTSLNANMVPRNVTAIWCKAVLLPTAQTMTRQFGQYATYLTPHNEKCSRLIVCMMSSSSPDTAGPQCFQDMGLDYQPILVIDEFEKILSSTKVQSKSLKSSGFGLCFIKCSVQLC